MENINHYKDHSANIEKQMHSYADLTEDSCRKITALEQEIQKETGEKVALVAYRI